MGICDPSKPHPEIIDFLVKTGLVKIQNNKINVINNNFFINVTELPQNINNVKSSIEQIIKMGLTSEKIIVNSFDLNKDKLPSNTYDIIAIKLTSSYFTREIQKKIRSNFYNSLKKGGYLIDAVLTTPGKYNKFSMDGNNLSKIHKIYREIGILVLLISSLITLLIRNIFKPKNFLKELKVMFGYFIWMKSMSGFTKRFDTEAQGQLPPKIVAKDLKDIGFKEVNYDYLPGILHKVQEYTTPVLLIYSRK